MGNSNSAKAPAYPGIFNRVLGWLWRNGWRAALLLAGLLILGFGVALQLYHGWYHYNDYGYASLSTLSSNALIGVTSQCGYHQYADETYAGFLLTGAVISCVGFFLLRRRFSLRTMLIAVVFIGLIASLPKILPRPDRGRYLYYSFSVPIDWPPARKASLLNELQSRITPERLNTEFPDEAKSALGIGTLNSFRKTEEREKGKQAIVMFTELSPALNDQQITALAEFYVDYFNEVLISYCERDGQKIGVTLPFNKLGGRWSEFRNDWLKNRKP